MADPEYIVVGSGAGGGPLAARLAELGHRVLLLEAGGEEEPWNYQVPVLHGLATEDEEMRLDHYIRHYADDTRQQKDPKYEAARGGVFYPRARTLGGCTAHYAMIIIRPHDSDWQAVRDATRDGSWAPAEMNKYFARVERCLYRDGSTGGHGKDGWLPTRLPDVLDLAGDIIHHRDPSIAKIAIEAKRATRRDSPSVSGMRRTSRTSSPRSRPERHAGAGTARNRSHRGAHGHQREWPAGRHARAHRGGRPGHRPAGGPHPQPRDWPRLRRAGPAAGRRRPLPARSTSTGPTVAPSGLGRRRGPLRRCGPAVRSSSLPGPTSRLSS